jgi:hypothetical protein
MDEDFSETLKDHIANLAAAHRAAPEKRFCKPQRHCA